METIARALRRRRDRRRMRAAASAITVSVVLGTALGVADVERDRYEPKESALVARTTEEPSTDLRPPVVIRPAGPPDGVTRAS